MISEPETGPAAAAAAGHVLIIDDDRSVLDTFARILRMEGFGVTTALSAESGLELARSVRPQAIILDLRMPAVTGLQFLRCLRCTPTLEDIPVGIVTGDVFLTEETEEHLQRLGATIRYKPLWFEELSALARTLIGARAR